MLGCPGLNKAPARRASRHAGASQTGIALKDETRVLLDFLAHDLEQHGS